MTRIHPTAFIDPTAEIADDASVGPCTSIGPNVRIGPGCEIGAYATLGENLALGREVRIFNYACVGTASQDKKHRGEPSRAEIGDRTVVREFATVNRATREGGVTRVGADVLLMAYSHVAHDCRVGDGAVLTNAATLGGEVVVEPGVVLGGLACVHQYCRIGRRAIVGAGSKVAQDIAPYLMVDGHPARPFGPNVVGLRRARFTEDQILEIRRIYRALFDRRRPFAESLDRVERDFADSAFAEIILEFCRLSARGVARPRPRPAGAVAAFAGPAEFDAEGF